ncbi:MAG: rRNA maturation RNase YbeY [Candidatus Lariskella arthropodorum]
MKINCEIRFCCSDWRSLRQIKQYIRSIAKCTLTHFEQFTELKSITISILLASDYTMQELNLKHRNKNLPTNVLSFPYEEHVLSSHFKERDIFLGDLAFAFGVIERDAVSQGKEFQAHFAHLIVHGILHLLGFDHILDVDREIMEALEIKILSKLGIIDPYELH